VRLNGPLPAWQVAAIGEQLLTALQAAHDAGIVHRDVKPGNVMVAANGRTKLTDFGIAQAIDDPRLTTSGMIVGSPAFMAPERVEGREAMPESDLWSLGATLFFAVEGIMAFERSTTAATLHAIMTEVPYLTRGQGPLAAAIMGMLISNPEARISATQARGLLAMAGSPAGQATPPGGHTAVYTGQPPTRYARGPAQPGASKAKRTAWLVGGAVLTVAALAGGLLLGKAIFTPAVDAAMLPTMTYGIDGDIKLDENTSYACFNATLQLNTTVGQDNQVSCEKNHTVEIYDGANVLGDANSSDRDAVTMDYPGAEAVKRIAESRCAAGFHTNLIPESKRNDLNFRALVPSENEWRRIPEQYNDLSRAVYCVLTKSDNGQLTSQIHAKIK
jgi:hypothetical protein